MGQYSKYRLWYKGTLKEERKNRLNEIGLKWRVAAPTALWGWVVVPNTLAVTRSFVSTMCEGRLNEIGLQWRVAKHR